MRKVFTPLPENPRDLFLTVYDEDSEPAVVNLGGFEKEVVTFGRDVDNDIKLNSRYSARRHGKFVFRENGWHIIDGKSLNGLTYKGSAIERKALEDGDIITIGEIVRLVFSYKNPDGRG